MCMDKSKLFKNSRAVSPVVGVILMVAITIVLAATMYLWITSLQPRQEATPLISAEVQIITVNDHKVLEIVVLKAPENLEWSRIKLVAYGEEFDLGSIMTGTVDAGDTIYIYNDGRTLQVSASSNISPREDIPSEGTLMLIDKKTNTVVFETNV